MTAKFLILIGLFCLTPLASAEVFKCRGSDGKVIYSNTGCPAATATVEVRPDEVVSPAARAETERELERMRRFIEEREATQQKEAELAEAARKARAEEDAAKAPPPPPPDPQYIVVNPAAQCAQRVQMMQLPPDEQQRQIARCYGMQAPPPRPERPMTRPEKPEAPVRPTTRPSDPSLMIQVR
jgi:hypothetical protein